MIPALVLGAAALSFAFAPLTGVASWYSYHEGQAAAGPALRRMLGKDWRGQTVTVCRLSTCIRVRLTDWCGCYGSRVIDLDDADFSRLAPLSRGLVRVRAQR